jgi:hypothetical protein
MKETPLTQELVDVCRRKDDPWRVGNQVLYDLCRNHPRHDNDAEIVAKVWLIGRAYAAALERGRANVAGPDVSNDAFYTERVTHALRESDLDSRLKALENTEETDAASFVRVLETHAYVVRLFEKLTGKGKRSLASKYLHFHRPSVFFIYDSRAVAGIRLLALPRQAIDVPATADRAYAQFVRAALGLRERVSSEFGVRLNPRQLDRLLLAAFAR